MPPKVHGQEVKHVLFLVILNGFAPTDEVYIDDMAMYRLGDLDP